MPVRKRKRGKKTVWIVDFEDTAGRRRRLHARTQEEANLLLAEKLKEARIAQPAPAHADKITVEEYGATWMRRVEADRKYSTARSYRSAFTNHVAPEFGSLKLREVTRVHVKGFVAAKRDGGLSKNTVHLIRAVLSSMLSEAVDDGLLQSNAATAAGRRGGKRIDTQSEIEDADSIRPFSDAQVAALLAAAADFEGRTWLLLLVRTGIRPGEAEALRWSDFDLQAREVLIERAIYEGHLGTPKTGRRRRVDMSQELTQALAALYVQREREKLAGRWPEIPAWVFPGKDGSNPSINWSRIFDRTLKRAGMSGHTTYDLRHTFATLLLAGTAERPPAPITYVSRQLGHANPGITLKYYAHWIPNSSDKRFVDGLDDPSPANFGTTFGTTLKKPLHLQGESTDCVLNFG